MTIKTSSIRLFLLVTMFLASFHLFSETSIFDLMITLSGSFIRAVVIINFLALIFIIVLPLAGVRIDKIIYTISILFCFPAVVCYSKINWLEMVLGIKFINRQSAIVTGMITLYVVLSTFFVNRLLNYKEQNDKWKTSGAMMTDILDVFVNRVEILIFAIILVVIPMILVLVSSSGIMWHVKSFAGPLIMAVLGTIISTFLVYSFLDMSKK